MRSYGFALALALLASSPGPTGAWAQQFDTQIWPVPTVSLTEQQFLAGSRDGTPAVIAGQLRVPRGGNRRPAVVLVHGSNGIRANVLRWADELSAIGLATFVLDSFTGRQITETATAQELLSTVAMTVDAYRALDVIGRHPRIDRRRVAIMGFSKGGSVALSASLRRFQALHGSPALEFAAHVALYPGCQRRFIDDENVVERPIRIYHGEADDWVPIAPCRAYIDRLRKAGKDAELTSYPDAHHAFDSHLAPRSVRLPNVQTGPTCAIEERPGGVMVSMPSGKPWSFDDPCVERGATIGYHPGAHAKVLTDVKAFLSHALRGD